MELMKHFCCTIFSPFLYRRSSGFLHRNRDITGHQKPLEADHDYGCVEAET